MAPVLDRSPGEYTRLLDTTGQSIRTLKKLGRPTEHWDDWFVHVIVFKLDQQTREDWEKSLEGSEEYPTYEKLASFLEKRGRALDNAHCNSSKTNNVPSKGSPKAKSSPQDKSCSVAAHHPVANSTGVNPAGTANGPGQDRRARDPCIVCQGTHFIAQCPTYLQATSTHRKSVVDQLHLCRNCLRPSHLASACPSKYRCRFCQQGHHTCLHVHTPAGEYLPPGPHPQLAAAPANPPAAQGPQAYVSRVGSPILLGTARVLFESPTGLQYEARVLIDPDSQGHMLTERIIQLLHLKKTITPTNIQGIGGVTAKSSSITTAVVRSLTQRNFVVSFSALVLPQLTSLLPSTRVERHFWPHLQDLQLADPEFFQPAEVDGILGADIYALIIQTGLRHGEMGAPVGQLTKLGWILTGPAGPPHERLPPHVNSFDITLPPLSSTADELRRFWEIEEIPVTRKLTTEEQQCEDHFVLTHGRDTTGRYVLRLPFKEIPRLEDDRYAAVARLQQVERRLSRDPNLAKQYYRFMDEYEQPGHLENVPTEQLDTRPRRYVKHHGVLTTKLRVVFSDPRLNECLHTGPKLQHEIDTVILRCRLVQFAFTADIVKMYRQIRIHPDDVDWLRAVMRTSPEQAVADKRLLTVTYGTSCAPFQALRTLQQLAEDEGGELPLAADVLRKHVYVDDALAGADTMEEARAIRDQFVEILRRAGMSLDKWATNTPELLPESILSSDEHIFDPDNTISTLGLK